MQWAPLIADTQELEFKPYFALSERSIRLGLNPVRRASKRCNGTGSKQCSSSLLSRDLFLRDFGKLLLLLDSRALLSVLLNQIELQRVPFALDVRQKVRLLAAHDPAERALDAPGVVALKVGVALSLRRWIKVHLGRPGDNEKNPPLEKIYCC
jgi:hypothetical protein